MKHLILFESFTIQNRSTLIIVDVQQSFKKFFTNNYLAELNKYCLNFEKVYQVFDNHHDGQNPDKDFLYDENPNIEDKSDLYMFNNQTDQFEKRYKYDVDVNYFKNILDNKTYKEIKEKETKKLLKRGDIFKTTEGTMIVYIGNAHKWMHLGKKLCGLFTNLKGQEVVMVGGSKNECLFDLEVSARSLGVKIKLDNRYIYSGSYCPIK